MSAIEGKEVETVVIQVNQRKTPSLTELLDLKPPSYNTFKMAQVDSVIKI